MGIRYLVPLRRRDVKRLDQVHREKSESGGETWSFLLQ
jgi:hypothetical protein